MVMTRPPARRRLNLHSIRSRLLFAFVLTAILPTIGMLVSTQVVGYANGRQQAFERLESAALRVELELKALANTIQTEMLTVMNERYAPERATVVLELAAANTFVEYYVGAMRVRLQYFVDQSRYLRALFLADRDGNIVVSSDSAFMGTALPGSLLEALRQNAREAFGLRLFSTERYAFAAEDDLIALLPVASQTGRIQGYLVGLAYTSQLRSILLDHTGLGETGGIYLVSASGDLLSLGDSAAGPQLVVGPLPERASGIAQALQSRQTSTSIASGIQARQVVATQRWLPELQTLIVIEQDVEEAFAFITAPLQINGVIVLTTILLTGLALLWVTRTLSTPIIDLAQTASAIASGDLQQRASLQRHDELGMLAAAFNSMTGQLQTSITHLEQRVRERTAELRQQALRLETSVQVSREITSILDIDSLLLRVVELIREAFGYYHVRIFLMEEQGEYLTLQASTGPEDDAVKRLPVASRSLNGQAAAANEARLANNVIYDPDYMAEPLLPNTRAELVIPLRIGRRVIGTLDVNSAHERGFSEQDVVVIQSLGDQVAIAIENARLYNRSRTLAVLEERNRLARELHDSTTQALYSIVLFAGAASNSVGAGQYDAALRHLARIETTAEQALKEMRLLLYELRPKVLEQEGLIGALQQRLDAVERQVGIEAQLSVGGELPDLTEIEGELYRIAQEALNNALKHASASSIVVHLASAPPDLLLEICDDGQGFAPHVAAPGGVGLAGMRERAAQMGGALEIHSAPGAGTVVRLRVRTQPPGTSQSSGRGTWRRDSPSAY